ncbi:VOC family protein [Camelliibacillus cellulosilyticus]|uniref:VOC family protein n=1 Tax=Camelliibacillus cellulosilyticus TaxID=2174486 RepID=A0ABV9GQ03_9BACL
MQVTGFNHLTINIRHLETSLDFYHRKLGMTLVHRGKRDAYLEWGQAWMCLQERPDFQRTARDHIGFDHVAFSINDDAFDSAVDDLKDRHIFIEKGPIIRGLGRSVYFRDPDGNLLELHTTI